MAMCLSVPTTLSTGAMKITQTYPNTIVIAVRRIEVANGLATYCLDTKDCDSVVLATTIETLLKRTQEIRPIAVITDLALNHDDSLDIIKQIRNVQPDVPIIAIGNYTAPSLVNFVFKQGANAYLLAMPLKQQLLDTLSHVCNNRRVIDKQLAYLLPLVKDSDTFHIV